MSILIHPVNCHRLWGTYTESNMCSSYVATYYMHETTNWFGNTRLYMVNYRTLFWFIKYHSNSPCVDYDLGWKYNEAGHFWLYLMAIKSVACTTNWYIYSNILKPGAANSIPCTYTYITHHL